MKNGIKIGYVSILHQSTPMNNDFQLLDLNNRLGKYVGNLCKKEITFLQKWVRFYNQLLTFDFGYFIFLK